MNPDPFSPSVFVELDTEVETGSLQDNRMDERFLLLPVSAQLHRCVMATTEKYMGQIRASPLDYIPTKPAREAILRVCLS